LREADLVVLAGAPCDFRLDYGRDISGGAKLIAANLDAHDVRRNRRPTLGVVADPGRFLIELARAGEEGRPVRERDLSPWIETLRARDDARQAEIARRADEPVDGVNPLRLAMEIDRATADDSVVVVDGGDFVATTSYVVRPRGPLRWLDPGVFGTLGVGAGFALGAKLVRPDAEVWLLYGDGSAAYSIAEFDTFVRHGLPVIAVVGNDGAWSQIARDQIELLHDDVGTRLRRTDYHLVAEGYGGKGSLLTSADDIATTLREAKRLAAAGHPVLINAHIGQTDFRKGSLSI
jgi:acetolactate synthase-1/2/3 large subunit